MKNENCSSGIYGASRSRWVQDLSASLSHRCRLSRLSRWDPLVEVLRVRWAAKIRWPQSVTLIDWRSHNRISTAGMMVSSLRSAFRDRSSMETPGKWYVQGTQLSARLSQSSPIIWFWWALSPLSLSRSVRRVCRILSRIQHFECQVRT